MRKLKPIKNCSEFCKKVRELIPDKRRHSWVLSQGVKLGFLETKPGEDGSIRYKLKDGIQLYQEDVQAMADLINSVIC